MSEPQWKKKLKVQLDENDYELRKEAKKVLGNSIYWEGYFWCLSLLADGKQCRKRYKSEKTLKNHWQQKHCGANLPGKDDPNAIVEDKDDIESIEEVSLPDDVVEEIEDISTQFTFTNGIFHFIDE